MINPAAGTITGAWEETDALTFGGTLASYLAGLNAGNLYINVHTVAFPPGEIRGQIEPAPPVPALNGIGLAALALLVAGGALFTLRRRIA